MEKKIIINIGRQFGGGGLGVASELGKKLGIPVYDSELLQKAAQDSGFSATLFEQSDEKRRIFSLSSIFTSIYSAPAENYMSDKGLFEMQCETIRKIAQQGSAIIVGRCADYILKDMNPYRIFVYADMESRMKRCRDKGEVDEKLSDKKLKKMIKGVDKQRKQYYEFYTASDWGNKLNYDICVNTSGKSIKEIVEEIITIFK